MSIVEVMLDQDLFGSYFPEPETWVNWMAFLDVFEGQDLTPAQLEAYQKFTGRTKYEPGSPFDTAYVISGRRSGKSRIASVVAVYLALFSGLHEKLSPGETGWVLIIAGKKEQAQAIFGYVKALAQKFKKDIIKENADEVWFANGTAIKVTAGTWRGVRGATVLGCLVDELAFLRSDEERWTANPAEELLRAIRPAIVKHGKLLAISTVYAARGPLYAAWKKNWGRDSKTLVWLATTPDMNPTFNQAKIDEEMEEDRANALSEYYSQWREDLQTLIESSLVRACMMKEEMPPVPGLRYTAFLDLSGNKSDSHALAICHKEKDLVVLDTFLEIEPGRGTVDAVVTEFSKLAKVFGVREISADAFGAEWASEPFRRAGVPLIKSLMPASNIFLNAAQLIRSGKVALVFSERVLSQFMCLDRRPGPGGVDVVQKVPGSHVDLVNAICGAVVTASLEVVRVPALPVIGHHQADRYLSKPIKDARRREEVQRNCEDEMDDFMHQDGHATRVGQGIPRKWWQ
ncbi:MAG: terminase large subunit [Acidobacteriota bacterium]